MSILDTIVAQKQLEVRRLPDRVAAPAQLAEAFRRRGGGRDFVAAVRQTPWGRPALIAEVKKASPSAGVIRPDFDPVQIARDYQAAGADCLSVLTDVQFFQGSLEYLRDIRSAVNLPLLRKDFIIDERQIEEAIVWGADAILLIAAILPDPLLRHLHTCARNAGLAVLVEVHEERELQRALDLEVELVGINNRDLRSFHVDLTTTKRLGALLRAHPRGPSVLLVAESGIHRREDVRQLADWSADAILVGESLMRQPKVSDKVRGLMGRERGA